MAAFRPCGNGVDAWAAGSPSPAPMLPLVVLPFPAIDPVAVSIGPLAIRWYALAYIAGLLGGWRYARRLCAAAGALGRAQRADARRAVRRPHHLGGARRHPRRPPRLRALLQPGSYLANPLEILAVWHGGMSFHGGLLGVGRRRSSCFARRNGFPIPCSAMPSPPRRRSASSSGASPTSSTASSGAGAERPDCPLGRRLPGRRPACRATRASSTRPPSRGSCCSSSWRSAVRAAAACRPAGPHRRALRARLRPSRIVLRDLPRADAQLGFLFGTSVEALGRRLDHGDAAVDARWRSSASSSSARAARARRGRGRPAPSRPRREPLTDELRRADRRRAGRSRVDALHGALPRPSRHGYYATRDPARRAPATSPPRPRSARCSAS